MRELAEGVWSVDGPSLRMTGGIVVPSRAIVLALADGGRLVYSPIAEMTVADVRRIVAPSRFHHRFVAAAQARWPGAMLHAPDGERAIDDAAITVEVIGGVPKLDEAVVFHRPSGTLVCADFVFNIERAETLLSRIAFAATGIGGGRLAQSREWSWLCRDRQAMRASVERILAWPIRRVVPCHGAPIEIDSAGLARVMR